MGLLCELVDLVIIGHGAVQSRGAWPSRQCATCSAQNVEYSVHAMQDIRAAE